LGICDEFESYRSSLLLASGSSFNENTANQSVETLFKFKVFGHFEYSLFSLSFWKIKFQFRCKFERFSYSQCLHQDIGLHDVISKLTESLVVVLEIISIELAIRGMINTACENIKQGCFTSATGTHNRVDFPGLENTTDVFKDGFFDGTFLARDFAFDSFIWYLDRV
jgi:hypothetical protein